MALIVKCELVVQNPGDQVPIANSVMGEITLNVQGNDPQTEVDLALSSLDSIISQARELVESRLQDWKVAVETLRRQQSG